MANVFSPYKVSVVVDREFGEQLATLAPGVPVWIVDTPTNKAVAKRLWKERPHDNSLTGITTFNFSGRVAQHFTFRGKLSPICMYIINVRTRWLIF